MTTCKVQFPGCLTSTRVLKKGNSLPKHNKTQGGMHEIGSTSDPNARIDEAKVVVTLRSGTELRLAIPEPAKKAPTVVKPLEEEQTSSGRGKTQCTPSFPIGTSKKEKFN